MKDYKKFNGKKYKYYGTSFIMEHHFQSLVVRLMLTQ
jgi:hypothetical protein